MTSQATREFLAGLAIAQRLGRPHTPTDQAWIESLFGHVKGEWPHLEQITDPAVLERRARTGPRRLQRHPAARRHRLRHPRRRTPRPRRHHPPSTPRGAPASPRPATHLPSPEPQPPPPRSTAMSWFISRASSAINSDAGHFGVPAALTTAQFDQQIEWPSVGHPDQRCDLPREARCRNLAGAWAAPTSSGGSAISIASPLGSAGSARIVCDRSPRLSSGFGERHSAGDPGRGGRSYRLSLSDGAANSSSWMLSGSRNTSTKASGIELAGEIGEQATDSTSSRVAHDSRSRRSCTANAR